MLFFLARSEAQEAVRPSQAGAEVAAAQMRVLSEEPYNLKAGPVQFRFGIDLDAEYNDNINIAETNRQSDLILEPQLKTEGIWRISSLNVLRFSLGVGFDKYLIHSQYDSDEPLLSPGTAISFDLFLAGNVRITFHERIDIAQDPIDEPTLSNTAEFRRLENTAGFTALWDLNKLMLTAGYDHFNYVSLDRTFSDLDREADSVLTSAAWSFNETTRAGLNLDATFTDYRESFHNDSTALVAGPFLEVGLSSYIKLLVAGGYQSIQFDRSGSIEDHTNLNDWYGNMAVAHRFNRFFTETLTAGHESQLGLNSNYEAIDYIRYKGAVTFLKDFTTEVDAMFEELAESGGALPEHLQRYGFGISLVYQLTQSVQAKLGYNFLDKQSDLAGFSYEQDRVHLALVYQF